MIVPADGIGGSPIPLPAGTGGGFVATGAFANMTVNLGPVGGLEGTNPGPDGGLGYNPRGLKRDLGGAMNTRYANYTTVLSTWRYPGWLGNRSPHGRQHQCLPTHLRRAFRILLRLGLVGAFTNRATPHFPVRPTKFTFREGRTSKAGADGPFSQTGHLATFYYLYHSTPFLTTLQNQNPPIPLAVAIYLRFSTAEPVLRPQKWPF